MEICNMSVRIEIFINHVSSEKKEREEREEKRIELTKIII